jgi:hypothetical protein
MSDLPTSDATREDIDFLAECPLATARKSEGKSVDRDHGWPAGEQRESS